MNIPKITLAYFSPTHTSYKVAQAVADGVGPKVSKVEMDATFSDAEPHEFEKDELLIVSVPVYGGAVAPIALQRLKHLKGCGNPAVVITVYGNRDFGKAPVELTEFLKERNFVTIAAGAFVGEHSYSTDETPIAVGRPDAADLNEARKWGEEIKRKLSQDNQPKAADPTLLKCPKSGWHNLIPFIWFVYNFKREMKKHPVVIVPEVNADLCNGCGLCARECPTGAIPMDDLQHTDAAKCIKCARCVKNCPRKARKLNTPFGPKLSKYFKKPKNNVTVL